MYYIEYENHFGNCGVFDNINSSNRKAQYIFPILQLGIPMPRINWLACGQNLCEDLQISYQKH